MSSHPLRLIGCVVLLLCLGLASCTSSTPTAKPPASPSIAPPASPTTPRTTPSTAPTTPQIDPTPPDPTALKPGTNHNYAAEEYVYPAKDVQSWLRCKKKAKNYPKQKLVFLTIDDGPTNSSTPKVLDILKRKGVPATFFYIGKNEAIQGGATSLPRRAIAEGHAIAVHSYTHNYSYLYPGGVASADRVSSEYDKTIRVVRKAVGSKFSTNSFRYPGGHMSWRGMKPADRALQKKGAYWIDWNAMDGDGEATAPATPAAAAEYVNATLDSRENPNVAVVLLHDYKNNQLTIGALPMIIDNLKDKGYTFGVID